MDPPTKINISDKEKYFNVFVYCSELLPPTLTCQLAWQTVQMGKQFAPGRGFDQACDPACLPTLPGALRGAAEGPRSLLWGIHRTDPHCRRTAAPSGWWSAGEPEGNRIVWLNTLLTHRSIEQMVTVPSPINNYSGIGKVVVVKC